MSDERTKDRLDEAVSLLRKQSSVINAAVETWLRLETEGRGYDSALENAHAVQRQTAVFLSLFATDDKEPENVPCVKCGRTDLPLHVNRKCPECYAEDQL